jgi:hypothetical protein
MEGAGMTATLTNGRFLCPFRQQERVATESRTSETENARDILSAW